MVNLKTILFWNLAKKQNALEHLSCLALTHRVDVFLLAESSDDLSPVLQDINKLGLGTYREADYEKTKVRAITRLAKRDFVHRYTSQGREVAIWRLRSAVMTPPEILIAGVLLPSKMGGNSVEDQASVAMEVSQEIAAFEDRSQHRNSLLIGDFNMYPYDPGMTLATGIHGLMTRALAELPDREHRGQLRRRFYNPMWGLLGDRTVGPAGSHFWRSSVLHNPHWGMLDQALLRPSLIQYLKDVFVLDFDGNHNLLGSDGAPDKNHLSDHLPIMLRLNV